MRMSATGVLVLTMAVVGLTVMPGGVGGGTWCISRSGATATALQAALDYACGSGVADCLPVQASGFCYLPNTLAAHASYAFNSFYQRSNAAPGACDFAGTATVTITDPSYGSCTYPSSVSTAGGSINTPNTNTPATAFTPPTTPAFGGTAGLTPPGFGSTVPDIDISIASPLRRHSTVIIVCLFSISMLFLMY